MDSEKQFFVLFSDQKVTQFLVCTPTQVSYLKGSSGGGGGGGEGDELDVNVHLKNVTRI